MPKTMFISSKPKNWETPFPSIGEFIRAVANVLETKGNSPKNFDRAARGDLFDYEKIEVLWNSAFNLPEELIFGKIKEVIDDIRENLLNEYIYISNEGLSCGYSRKNITGVFYKKLGILLYDAINEILEKQNELLHELITSDTPISIAFRYSGKGEWDEFRNNPHYGKCIEAGDIKENVYRWIRGEQVPGMKILFDVINFFCDCYNDMEVDNIYKVFFCAKIINNIGESYPQILDELRNKNNHRIITLDEYPEEPLERTLYNLYGKFQIQKSSKRAGEYFNLYEQIENELRYKESHKIEDKELFDAQLKELESMTNNLQDIHICWWNTQRLRAYWYVLSGEWDLAKACYEEIIDIIFYTGDQNRDKIFREAIVLAAIQKNRPFLKKLKHFGVVFGLFGRPYTNDDNREYSNANKESRSKKYFVVEDSEVKDWASDFYEIFPKDKFFVSENKLPKSVKNPLLLNCIDDEMPKEADLKKKNKSIDLNGKKYPQLVYFTEQRNIQEVKKLLEAGVDVNQLSSSSESALLFAIREMDMTVIPGSEERNMEFFNILSEYPHKKETLEILTNKRHLSILGSAVETGNIKIVDKVLEMMREVNANINIKYGADNITPLYKAIRLFTESDIFRNPSADKSSEFFEFTRRTNPFVSGITTEEVKRSYEKIHNNHIFAQNYNMVKQVFGKIYEECYKPENLLEIIDALLNAGADPSGMVL